MEQSADRSEWRALALPEAQVLRARAEAAREQAREAARRYANLAARYEQHVRWQYERISLSFDALEHLRQRVREYSALLKELDTPPERALASVKQAVFDDQHLDMIAAHALRDSVVRWFVEAFYAA